MRIGKNTLIYGMAIGFVLGILSGVFTPGFALSIKFLGTLFLNALKMVVLPLIIRDYLQHTESRRPGRVRGHGRKNSYLLPRDNRAFSGYGNNHSRMFPARSGSGKNTR